MPKIHFVNEFRTVEIDRPGRTVLDVLLENGINPMRETFLGLNCHGHGVCPYCKVFVKERAPGAVSPPNLRERLFGNHGWRRMACQTKILGDVDVWTMPAGPERTGMVRPVDRPPSPVAERAAAGGATAEAEPAEDGSAGTT